MNYVFVPGAWAGGWIWDRVVTRLQYLGHTTFQLTLPGLGKEPDPFKVRLADHITFVNNFLELHCLRDIILVGHSYSGIVVGQVASMSNQFIAHTVFIEAFLPISGKSLLEVSGLDILHEQWLIDKNKGLWPAPNREELRGQPYLTSELIDLLVSKQKDHPGKTVTDKAQLHQPLTSLCSTFISRSGWLESSREAKLVDTLRVCAGWVFKEIEGGHWPMLTIPDQISTILHEIYT